MPEMPTNGMPPNPPFNCWRENEARMNSLTNQCSIVIYKYTNELTKSKDTILVCQSTLKLRGKTFGWFAVDLIRTHGTTKQSIAAV